MNIFLTFILHFFTIKPKENALKKAFAERNLMCNRYLVESLLGKPEQLMKFNDHKATETQ